MKNIVILLVCIISANVYSQEQEIIRYFLEVSNKEYIPIANTKLDGTLDFKVDENLKDATLINSMLSSYTIHEVADIFSNSTNSVLRKSIVFDLSKHDDIDILVKMFPLYYPSYIKETVYEPLDSPQEYYPDDFENPALTENFYVDNYDHYEQNELKMIRAPEAWNITKGIPEVIIGIADQGFDVKNNTEEGHEDLTGEFVGGLLNYDNQYGSHGNAVATFASGKTDNGLGTSSIGFNTKMIGARGGSVSNLLQLAQFNPKPKVVNLSFGSDIGGYNETQQGMINDINALDVTVVIAGGNGQGSGTGSPSTYYYPASYKNVIAVSSVGNKNEIGSTAMAYDNWKDVHDVIDPYDGQSIVSHQHNDSIDIVVPEYFPGVVAYKDIGEHFPVKDDYRRVFDLGGTSFSAPIVAGTIGLMHSVNYCIKPNEVETILKLTAVKIDDLPENIQYYGKLGAGRLDAYEAVKMAKEMADTFGTVEVKDRILYRSWFYKLETAPYEIKMSNNDVSGGSKLKFKARNNIEILSGNYQPDTGGYVELSIDGTLSLDCPFPNSSRVALEKGKTKNVQETNLESEGVLIFPNPTKGILNIANKGGDLESISISDFTGRVVFYKENVRGKKLSIDMSMFNSGLYLVIVVLNKGEIVSKKIIKN